MSKAATDAPGHSEQLVELWSTGLVGRDHLAVDYRFVDVERGRHLVAECLETAQDIAVARDEAAAALLKIAEATEAIIFELKEPFGVVERLFSPGRDDRLYAGQCHPADMARPAGFVQRPPAAASFLADSLETTAKPSLLIRAELRVILIVPAVYLR